MSRILSLCVVLCAFTTWAQPEDADAGTSAPMAPPDAGAPPPGFSPDAGAPAPAFIGFDGAQGPWGPARRSAGDRFSSAATALAEGPLRWSWNDFSLALGGQYFGRGELRDNADLRSAADDHVLGLEQRARLSVRASAKNRVGVLVEFQDVRAWSDPVAGAPGTTGLHQGFVDVHLLDGLDVRIGRQELAYGEERVLGAIDWAMAARSFDGLFVRVSPGKSVTLDAFGLMLKPPAFITPTNGGGRFHNSGTFLTGVYARVRQGWGGVDVYGLGLFDDPATAASGLSKDNNSVSLGARGFVSVGGLHIVAEGVFQTGKVGAREELLLAGGTAVKATYTFASVWGAPYVLGEFTTASPTFVRLFPTAHAHLGFMDYVGWQNVIAGRGTIGFRPLGAHVWLDVHHFAAWDPKAAWFMASGATFLPADPTRTDGNMGTELDLSATVPLIPNLALAGCFSVFLPGGAAQTRGTEVSTWGFLAVRAQL